VGMALVVCRVNGECTCAQRSTSMDRRIWKDEASDPAGSWSVRSTCAALPFAVSCAMLPGGAAKWIRDRRGAGGITRVCSLQAWGVSCIVSRGAYDGPAAWCGL